MNTQQQIAEYNWIRQGWQDGTIDEYQLWDLANGRLELQHHIRLFLELGFVPCSGFPLVPTRIKEWSWAVGRPVLVGKYGQYTAGIAGMLTQDIAWEIRRAGAGVVASGQCKTIESAQWGVEAFLRDEVTPMSKRYALVPVDYGTSTGYMIRDTLFNAWEKLSPRGVYGRSYSGEFYVWDKQTAVEKLDGLNERHEVRVANG